MISHNHVESNTLSPEPTSVEQCLSPFQRRLLQNILQQDDLPQKYRQRIQIMLLADEGKTQSQICQELGCSRVTIRHWILVAKSGEAHNWNASPLGRPKTVNDQYLEHLKELISHNPKELGYPFRRWTSQWLSKHLARELGVKVGVRHINRLLKEMGLSTRSQPLEPVDCNQNSHNSTRLVISDLTESLTPHASVWEFHSIN